MLCRASLSASTLHSLRQLRARQFGDPNCVLTAWRVHTTLSKRALTFTLRHRLISTHTLSLCAKDASSVVLMFNRWAHKTPHTKKEHLIKIQSTFESLDYENTESQVCLSPLFHRTPVFAGVPHR